MNRDTCCKCECGNIIPKELLDRARKTGTDPVCSNCGGEFKEYGIRVDVYAHEWGILVPCESGFIWEQQTRGVCCDHVYLEGVFVPLSRPYCYDPTHEHNSEWFSNDPSDLLAALQQANYGRTPELVDHLWDEIKEKMDFDFDDVEAPENQPKTQEGIRWVTFTKFRIKALVGKVVCLVYPNCD